MKLIVSLLAASLLAHTALAADQAIEVDRIVAVVNSDVITRTELRQRVEQVTRQLSRQGTSLPPADVLERQVLERQIVERLQLQLAGETSLRVDDVAPWQEQLLDALTEGIPDAMLLPLARTFGASAEAAERFVAGIGGALAPGVTMHQRPSNRVAKPAAGPLFSVPATGCAGMTTWPGSAFASASATPATSGASGPTITKSMAVSRTKASTRSPSSTRGQDVENR